MTPLGLFLTKKSVNRAMVSRRTGISQARLSQLSSNESTKLRADELYLIALAIDIDPCELLKEVFKGLKLPKE
ncbi:MULTISPECIES: helix-turn-helix transcriptional regulator [Flavobacteriaceae]|jgi:putative transcriptional regulator|uniref:Cro/C1-type HTH DNA-binding domain protein n=3 Tax=Arenibacter TaxID=178469 RepID=A0A221UYI4_9FLAO|nr:MULTISPECIES: helix-turn-helix transcriptional regulator [Flavobacteriaceae]ASO06417.1 Cro/C1-type HTH DNA-binding domain protein [Arenibacter algicola]MCK0135968.1 helix-turn-helix transcriptional regulator [Arenibacter sp. S6351L]MCK0192819.1 helix-turn-helix transcriptional regulator [Arenibacter sp. F20364]MCM4164568.1 DNA-binding protein [Arenibacter sp. A80]MDO6605660.1 helix-turn-helix transcriptional regulator [Arenibacter palladensis]|tara:strand:- start:346 stop:564 length:219 start_codon:yes stop_codon:yes gene_type:complete